MRNRTEASSERSLSRLEQEKSHAKPKGPLTKRAVRRIENFKTGQNGEQRCMWVNQSAW